MTDFAFRDGPKPRLLTAIKHEGKLIKGNQGEAHPKLAERKGVYSKQGDDWVQAVVRKGKEVKHIALTPEHAKAWVDQQDK